MFKKTFICSSFQIIVLSDNSVSGSILKSPVVQVTESPVTFTHQSDFDENGLLYWIGTNARTAAEWVNPAQGCIFIWYSGLVLSDLSLSPWGQREGGGEGIGGS